MIAKVRLPNEDSLIDLQDYHYAQKKEGVQNKNSVEIETIIPHEGEVNKARYMPQKYNIIATKANSGEVHIFDYSSRKSKPETYEVKPDLRLVGHSAQGFGLAWNQKNAGHILSGADDSKICLWDVEDKQQTGNHSIKPYLEFNHHKRAVNDVAWHHFKPEFFGSVSEDREICLWDIREKTTGPIFHLIGHQSEIFSLDFNPFNEYLFLTGSADKSIGLWDLRNLSKKLYSFETHLDNVVKVEWSPFAEPIFASASEDKRVNIWDLSKIGDETKVESNSDGPPELLFVHGGHRGKVCDFSWNCSEHMYIASTEDESNVLQIWQMAYNLYEEDNIL